jgi:hypothetical protein
MVLCISATGAMINDVGRACKKLVVQTNCARFVEKNNLIKL